MNARHEAAIEAAAAALCFGHNGEGCDSCTDPVHCCRQPIYRDDAKAVVAAYLAAMETPATDDAAFLSRMYVCADAGERVTAEDVARLRRLADWADAPPPPGWDGTLDKGETKRAIAAAEGRMRG